MQAKHTIGHYEILGVLGDGGMGTVYQARDPRFDRLVAIKVLHPQLCWEPEIVERFKVEAVVQAKLAHPHIVAVHDFIADDKTLAIVMESIDGLPLDRIIEQRAGRLPVDWCVGVMKQVLAAMGHAHGQGIVHRDLKPANILVTETDGGPFARVTDFGIVKVLGSQKRKTATGTKIGTVGYMSPEHVRSPRHVDARSDIYALGATLYEMLSGHLPFDDETEYELMRQIVEEPPPPLTRSDLPLGLRQVLATAMAKKPEQRFESCRAFLMALDHQGGPSPEAVSASSNADLRRAIPVPPVDGNYDVPPVLSTVRDVQPLEPSGQSSSLKFILGLFAVLCIVAAILFLNQPRPSSSTEMSPQAPAETTSTTPLYSPPAPTPPPAVHSIVPRPEAGVRTRPALPADREAGVRRSSRELDAADAAFEAAQYETAIGAYRGVLGRDPGNTRAKKGLDRAERALRAEQAVGIR